uniref:Uncharacterized protein n=1 Tax=Trieres chinensis TaxID=1514140 RepID=A0A7S2E9S6_TRICV|mmetsp:Transcript_14107/g.29002  ORF Transcript_14107/g.29002 Transcript_14107/m.29002 type:complete len:199 (+) Transcript_14107:2-598(+)
MKWLQEQGKKEKGEKKINATAEISSGSARDRARWLQEQAFKKTEKKEVEEKVEEEKEVDDEEQFSSVSARMKRFQGTKNKQEEKEEKADEEEKCSVSDRMKWLQGMSKKDKNVDDEDKAEKGGVKDVAKSFGGTTKKPVVKKSAVQLRREELERQEKEKGKNPNMAVSWRGGNRHGQFKKTSTDKRGPAPKKSLADLP